VQEVESKPLSRASGENGTRGDHKGAIRTGQDIAATSLKKPVNELRPEKISKKNKQRGSG